MSEIPWDPKAEKLLNMAPEFVRPAGRAAANALAAERGMEMVTPALLIELRNKQHGGDPLEMKKAKQD